MISNRIIKVSSVRSIQWRQGMWHIEHAWQRWEIASYLHLVFLYYIFPSCGICGGQSGIGTNSTIESFGFLLSFPGAPHSRFSFSHVINNWYNTSLWFVLIFPSHILCVYSVFRMHATCIVLSSTSKSYEQKVMWRPLLIYHHLLISLCCPVTTCHLGPVLSLNQFVALSFCWTWGEGVGKSFKY
jgi:hypothetical protein